MFSIKRNIVEEPLETVEIEINQTRKKLAKSNQRLNFILIMYPEKKRSNWWYLVPILFGIIGGIIGYYALRRDAPEKAKKCLDLGLSITAINIIANIALISVGLDYPGVGSTVNA